MLILKKGFEKVKEDNPFKKICSSSRDCTVCDDECIVKTLYPNTFEIVYYKKCSGYLGICADCIDYNKCSNGGC